MVALCYSKNSSPIDTVVEPLVKPMPVFDKQFVSIKQESLVIFHKSMPTGHNYRIAYLDTNETVFEITNPITKDTKERVLSRSNKTIARLTTDYKNKRYLYDNNGHIVTTFERKFLLFKWKLTFKLKVNGISYDMVASQHLSFADYVDIKYKSDHGWVTVAVLKKVIHSKDIYSTAPNHIVHVAAGADLALATMVNAAWTSYDMTSPF